MPLLEAVERAALRAGVPVDARIEKGRTPTHALRRLWDVERFDRIVAPAPTRAAGRLQREGPGVDPHARAERDARPEAGAGGAARVVGRPSGWRRPDEAATRPRPGRRGSSRCGSPRGRGAFRRPLRSWAAGLAAGQRPPEPATSHQFMARPNPAGAYRQRGTSTPDGGAAATRQAGLEHGGVH